jgi:hypothetical protein
MNIFVYKISFLKQKKILQILIRLLFYWRKKSMFLFCFDLNLFRKPVRLLLLLLHVVYMNVIKLAFIDFTCYAKKKHAS